jgi:hypothetical protein
MKRILCWCCLAAAALCLGLSASGCAAGLAGALVAILSSGDSGGGDTLPEARDLRVSAPETPDRILVEYRITGGSPGRVDSQVRFQVLESGAPAGPDMEAVPLAGLGPPDSVEPGGTVRFFWDAERALGGASNEVEVWAVPFQGGQQGTPSPHLKVRAGNTPVAIEEVRVSSAAGVLFISFRLLDEESDRATLVGVELAVSGGDWVELPEEASRKLRKDFPSAPRGAGGEEGSLNFASGDLDREGLPPELRELARPGFVGDLKARVWFRDWPNEAPASGESPATTFDNNDPPSVQLFPIGEAELESGVVPVRYLLFDKEKNPADLEVEVDLGDGLGFRPANEFPQPPSEGASGLAAQSPEEAEISGRFHTFLWDALSQSRGGEAVTMRLRARDREEGPASVSSTRLKRTSFETEKLPTGRTTWWLSKGDYDGDGFLDALVDNYDSKSVTYLKGGPRGLSVVEEIPVGPEGVRAAPYDVSSGNFNGDEYADAGIVNGGSNTVTYLEGGPQGPKAVRELPAGDGVDFSASADFDGDGLDDMVVSNENSNDVTYLKGSRPDGLVHVAELPCGRDPWDFAVGDFNQDGFPDFMVANNGSGDITYFQGGPGGPAPQRNIAVGVNPRIASSGDFNGDGVSDAIVSTLTSGDLTLLLGGPGGLVDLPERKRTTQSGYGAVWQAPGDFDADGFLDAVVSNYGENTASYFAGGPQGLTLQGKIPVDSAEFSASGDFDGDGYPDVVVSSTGLGRLSYLRGGPSGPRAAAEVRVDRGNWFLIPGDFDGDGIPEVLLAHNTAELSQVTFLRCVRSGLSPSGDRIASGAGPAALASGDFDGDRFTDLVAANRKSNTLTPLQGSPAGLIPSPEIEVGEEPWALATGDLNGDSFPDVLASSSGSGTVAALLGGPGGLSAAKKVVVQTGVAPRAIWAGDLNGDGLADGAALNWGTEDLTFLRGGGDGVARWEEDVPVGNSPIALLAADFSGDSFPDLAVANWDSGDVAFFPGGNSGPSREPVKLSAGLYPAALASGDFDGDGVLDLAVANWGTHDVAVFRGNAGASGTAKLVPAGRNPSALEAGDFDGDGFPDLAVLNYGSESVALLRGGPSGLAPPEREVAVAGPAIAHTSGDLDGDGLLDLLAVTVGAQDLSLLRGGSHGLNPGGAIPVATSPSGILARDFDGDAFLDAVACNADANDFTYLRQRYLVPHQNFQVDPAAPTLLVDPRNPSLYQLEVPSGGLPAGTPVCMIPATVFDLPQGEANARGKYFAVVTGAVFLMAGSRDFLKPLKLTLLIRPGTGQVSAGNLRLLWAKDREGGGGGTPDRAGNLEVAELGRSVSFEAFRSGRYLVAEERERSQAP